MAEPTCKALVARTYNKKVRNITNLKFQIQIILWGFKLGRNTFTSVRLLTPYYNVEQTFQYE